MAIPAVLFALALFLFLLGSDIRLSICTAGEEKPTVTVTFLVFRFRIQTKRKAAKESGSNARKSVPIGAYFAAGKFLLARSRLCIRGLPEAQDISELLFSLFLPASAAGLSILYRFAANTVTALLSSLCGELILRTDAPSRSGIEASLSFSLFTCLRAFLIFISKIGKEKFNDRKTTHGMDAGVA